MGKRVMRICAITSVSADCYYEAKTRAVRAILKYHGWDVEEEVQPQWTGFTAKLWWAHRCAAELTRYTHLMLIDARDVVLLAGPDEVLSCFLEFDHPWVCAAEPNIWPTGMYEPEDYPLCDTPYRYLNSGAYIAEREHLLACFERWPAAGVSPDVRVLVAKGEDGPWLTEQYLMEPGSILLDHNCELFQCACGSRIGPSPIIQAGPGVVYNRVTKSFALVIHANGGDDITAPDWRVLWDL
jgi:hypothetical protein